MHDLYMLLCKFYVVKFVISILMGKQIVSRMKCDLAS